MITINIASLLILMEVSSLAVFSVVLAMMIANDVMHVSSQLITWLEYVVREWFDRLYERARAWRKMELGWGNEAVGSPTTR